MANTLAYYGTKFITGVKRFYEEGPGAYLSQTKAVACLQEIYNKDHCYKTFYDRNLQVFVKS